MATAKNTAIAVSWMIGTLRVLPLVDLGSRCIRLSQRDDRERGHELGQGEALRESAQEWTETVLEARMFA